MGVFLNNLNIINVVIVDKVFNCKICVFLNVIMAYVLVPLKYLLKSNIVLTYSIVRVHVM